MSYPAIRSIQEEGLECYLLSLRAGGLVPFLRHDPRSSHWESLTPWLRGIYETKQRETKTARIDALDDYICNRMLNPDKFGALPPISVIQFQPFDPRALSQVESVMYQIEDTDIDVDRVLIDGLARITAVQRVRERLQVENPPAFDHFNATFRLTVALYVPTTLRLDPDIAGQLFADFNSYAWPVPVGTTIANDIYNPYRAIARMVGSSDLLRRYGGLKSGKSHLGRKDIQFCTEVAMSQFVKIVIEGASAYGSLNRPVPNARVATINQQAFADATISYLTDMEAAMGEARFGDRAAIFRSAHGFYALAMLLNDIMEGRTTQARAVAVLAGIDWTWSDPDFQQYIGRNTKNGWKMNTGQMTITWLWEYLRAKCGVVVAQSKAA